MNSPQARFARATALVVSAVWAIALFFAGPDIDSNLKRALAYVPSLVGVLVVVFDLFLWKIPGISKVTGKPRIDGTWRVTLTPNPDSKIPPDGNWGPITAAMVIEQTFWTVSVRMHTAESNSASTTAVLAPTVDSRAKSLYFTYGNRAHQANSNRSRAHQGTTHLQVLGPRPKALDGTYWTDRLTAGDITARWISKKTDLPAASALESVRTTAQP